MLYLSGRYSCFCHCHIYDVSWSGGGYDETNRMLFQEYVRTRQPDGKIIFLAANPDVKMKGIGSIGDLREAAGRTS